MLSRWRHHGGKMQQKNLPGFVISLHFFSPLHGSLRLPFIVLQFLSIQHFLASLCFFLVISGLQLLIRQSQQMVLGVPGNHGTSTTEPAGWEKGSIEELYQSSAVTRRKSMSWTGLSPDPPPNSVFPGVENVVVCQHYTTIPILVLGEHTCYSGVLHLKWTVWKLSLWKPLFPITSPCFRTESRPSEVDLVSVHSRSPFLEGSHLATTQVVSNYFPFPGIDGGWSGWGPGADAA